MENVFKGAGGPEREPLQGRQHVFSPTQPGSGHKEDILCIAHSAPSLLATASYDGEIIVWNLISGHVFTRFAPPVPEGYEEQDDTSMRESLRFDTASAYAHAHPVFCVCHGFFQKW